MWPFKQNMSELINGRGAGEKIISGILTRVRLRVSYLNAPSLVCKEEYKGAISFEDNNEESVDVNFTDGRAINIRSVSLVF